jgi:hypothetical protein
MGFIPEFDFQIPQARHPRQCHTAGQPVDLRFLPFDLNCNGHFTWVNETEEMDFWNDCCYVQALD